jgi:hypothetical protein
MLVGCCCCQATAEESGWWPFGRDRETVASEPSPAANGSGISSPAPAQQQAALPQYSDTGEPERQWMIQSPFANVSWPRVHMPELPKPKFPTARLLPDKTEVDAAKNAWVEKSPEPKEPSPLQAVTDGARRVRQSTRAAWDKTVNVFMQTDNSDSNSSRVARRNARPPIWKRMFSSNETQPEGSKTLPQWMAQDRVDP